MQAQANANRIAPDQVHDTLRRWMLVDGFPIVCDLEASHGATLVDARSGREYLDFFGCFGSTPIGWNPPALRNDDFLAAAAAAVVNKPSNSDLYTPEMAAFVDTFCRHLAPEGYRHSFYVDGGALAVENALKVAFDWKVRRNRAKGVDADVGTRILHFRHAFHGRSGYTMSLTNTDPTKVDYFPKFDWPRVDSPALHFPLDDDSLAAARSAEEASLAQIDAAFARYGDDIAAIIIEPIQCEGGDRHFRAEFLQALQARCERYDCLFIVDEVQVGYFASGRRWCFEHFDIQPDLIVFGKKTQQCGILAGPRVDLVPDNVFAVSSRINSTWGGNLVDMIRATRVTEEAVARDLAGNAAERGEQWLAGMAELAADHGEISNIRGRGLILAFDLPSRERRDAVLARMSEVGLLGLACGERSLRFRPHLAVTVADVDRCLELTAEALKR
ncbi:MAG: L-lysine 6-transaminase [Planctomycetota bacterium]|nr:MAG: L-lysine 6-transaminase [Planctomycetota bacterium]